MERTRESMARELVNLSNSNQEQEVKLQELESLKKRYKVTHSLARLYVNFMQDFSRQLFIIIHVCLHKCLVTAGNFERSSRVCLLNAVFMRAWCDGCAGFGPALQRAAADVRREGGGGARAAHGPGRRQGPLQVSGTRAAAYIYNTRIISAKALSTAGAYTVPLI